MTPESKVLAALQIHGPLTSTAVREVVTAGRNNIALAFLRLKKSSQIVVVQIGLKHFYGLPEHASALLAQKAEHDEAVARRIQACREASRAKEQRKRQNKSRRRYEWPSKLEFVPPPVIPISIFDYARQAGEGA